MPVQGDVAVGGDARLVAAVAPRVTRAVGARRHAGLGSPLTVTLVVKVSEVAAGVRSQCLSRLMFLGAVKKGGSWCGEKGGQPQQRGKRRAAVSTHEGHTEGRGPFCTSCRTR